MPAPKEKSFPKTTRPEAAKRRDKAPALSTGEKIKRALDALPDRIDLRDWFYQPHLRPLPGAINNCDKVPAILNQGREGACTGYALAAVINFHLSQRGDYRRVSPRMLYEMARCYDEWPGVHYEGASSRGAMKGWVRHGVCLEDSWPRKRRGPHHFTPALAQEATLIPGGAFYRVSHRQVRDMHAALQESGILYCSIMVHDGWDEPGPLRVKVGEWELPVIRRRVPAPDGHAIAIVGYNDEGFIIQNSWGPEWGERGFALLPYEDYMLHAYDVWVAQLGVPVKADLWKHSGGAGDTAGAQRASAVVPLADIRPFVVDLANNGQLSRTGNYWTTEEDLHRLFNEVIPERTRKWKRRRVMLYLHGGLNQETAVARRIIAFRDVMLDNEIYPIHIMWETGLMETLSNLFKDFFTDSDSRAGAVGDWLRKVRDGLIEAKDRTFELTVAKPGGAVWREMKENARLASVGETGGMKLLAKHAVAAVKQMDAAERAKWELHVVGHSAGSIFAAHATGDLEGLGIPYKTLQLMAPAITVKEFHKYLLPSIRNGSTPHPTLYLLSDVGERDDNIGPYGKSLLYLVSNAFEEARDYPLVGMERFVSVKSDDPNKELVDKQLNALFSRNVHGRPSLVVAGKEGDKYSLSRSSSHGGFDNDADTLNSVLRRILDDEPRRLFQTRDLQY